MIRLTPDQIEAKKHSIDNYIKASNAADGSILDANANVSSKNIATLGAELNKDVNIQVNRSLIKDRIKNRFGEDLATEYERQVESQSDKYPKSADPAGAEQRQPG